MGLRDRTTATSTGMGMGGVLSPDAKKEDEDKTLSSESTAGTQATLGPATIGSSATQTSAPVKAMPKQQKAGTGTFANLRSYLQAAQGGGQQRVAQAATQKVAGAATGVQKGLQQAQQAFGQRMEAGTIKNLGTAQQEAADIVKAAQGVTYQAPEQVAAQNQERANLENRAERIGINPPINPIVRAREDYLKNLLGENYQEFRNEMDSRFFNADNSSALLGSVLQKTKDIYSRYGIDETKMPGYRESNLEDNIGKIQTWGPESLADRSRENFRQSLEAQSQPTTTAPAPAPAQPQQYFTPEQQQRFSEIINAQYYGPASLQQAGLYEPVAQKARVAQEAALKAQTAGGREALLRDIFSRGRDYSRGASKLDALLLNTSEQGVQQLQQQAEEAAKSQEKLQTLQNLTAAEAQTRASDISGAREAARTALTETRSAEEKAATDYITNVQANWNKLPEYFKKVLAESATKTPARIGDINRQGNTPKAWNAYYDKFLAPQTTGTTYNLSSEEARILGFNPGEGLFGINPENIQATSTALGEELITKDQLSRQLALAQLANLDESGVLKKTPMYTDLAKAGTKDILSSLDTARLRAIQQENRKSMEDAVARMGSVSLGYNKQGYQPFKFSDILETGGYTPLDADTTPSEVNSQDVLKQIAAGQQFTPEQNASVENYIQKIFESPQYAKGFNTDQLTKWALQPLQKEIAKYGAFDTVQTVDNEQAKTRAEGLRKILSEIYKS